MFIIYFIPEICDCTDTDWISSGYDFKRELISYRMICKRVGVSIKFYNFDLSTS